MMFFFFLIVFVFIVENKENKIPSPFHFLNEKVTKVYMENETNHLLGRLTTPDGKIWLKFLPHVKIPKIRRFWINLRFMFRLVNYLDQVSIQMIYRHKQICLLINKKQEKLK